MRNLTEITNPNEIADKNKYIYYYSFDRDPLMRAIIKDGLRIQKSFSNKIGGPIIQVYRESKIRKIVRKIV
jgi:hypothetical protein